MPRRRNNVEISNETTPINDIASNVIQLIHPHQILQSPQKVMTAEYLKNNYFDMAKECNRKLDCPICLEDICCRKCFAMLPCGHFYHLSCLINIEKCALCRA